MDTLLHLIATYGLLVVFVSVFLDQGGVPIPAYPPIIVTTAVAVDAGHGWWPVLVVATLAAILADWLWFLGGRRIGARLVRLMCRLSLSPDSCVRTTRGIYARWGAGSLTVAKFFPGFAAVATTLAGETGTSTRRFLLFDGIGALLWAGVAVALGAVFHRAVDRVLAQLEQLGHYAIPVLLGLVAAFIAWKWLRRRHFLQQLRMARISVDELHRLLEGDPPPLLLDVRAPEQRAASGWIPGAVFAHAPGDMDIPVRDEVIVYCDCPNEVSAAVLARELQRRGFRRVRPLAGGFDAWQASGRQVDRLPA
ncbi:rhodanese-like domain-containing protein [Lysobacter solisilvae (ex Woo and Kim 2020)]|uniref:VTT domain-containing protein n=1 Tax=Agrilutibacter terrestris TaxID=2865112 RepID=A0A7H0G0S5_9GAMM|nr:VTT domain-containing protein [Lysobacter terrestris]QNP41891.1 VTT domain-containing protein [Lysobacter terrestris]